MKPRLPQDQCRPPTKAPGGNVPGNAEQREPSIFGTPRQPPISQPSAPLRWLDSLSLPTALTLAALASVVVVLVAVQFIDTTTAMFIALLIPVSGAGLVFTARGRLGQHASKDHGDAIGTLDVPTSTSWWKQSLQCFDAIRRGVVASSTFRRGARVLRRGLSFESSDHSIGTRGQLTLATLGVVGLVFVAWLTEEGLSNDEPELPPLDPTWAGCIEVRGAETPRCVFDPAEPFHLWLTHENANQVEVYVDDDTVTPEPYLVEELPGLGLRVSLPTTAHVLEIRVPGTKPWTLALQSKEAPDGLAGMVADITTLKHQADMLYFDGKTDEATALVEGALAQALQAELTSVTLDIALMAAYYLEYSGDPEQARDLLDRVQAVAQRFPKGRALWESRSALLLWGKGDLVGAAQGFRAAIQFAIRTDDDYLVAEVIPMYGAVLVELGYFSAVQYWTRYAIDRLEPDDPYYGQVLKTAAWVNLLLSRDGHPHDDPIVLYEQAVKLFEPDGSAHALDIGFALLGLAEAQLLAGKPKAAREQLERLERLAQAKKATLTFHFEAFRDNLELRIALELDEDPQILERSLAQLQRSVRQANTPEAQWWLAVRRGDVLARSGRWEDAADAYRESEDHLDQITRYAAFGVGQSGLGANRREGTLGLADALLELGRPAEALCALRQAEGRRTQAPLPQQLDPEQRSLVEAYVRKRQEFDNMAAASEGGTLGERVAGELDKLRDRINDLLRELGRAVGRPECEELSEQMQSELILGLYPTGDQWLVFAQDEQTTWYRVEVTELPRDVKAREALANALLSPIADRLKRAKRLRVLAVGKARELDVQVLPWREQPLLETITIVHGAELVPPANQPWPERPSALLVADPTRSLPGAEEEIAATDAALVAGGFSTKLVLPEQALTESIGQSLERVDLLHFSGHSRYPGVDDHGRWPPYAGGTPGQASHLVLAFDQRLAIHDILVLKSVPRVVVLEGCEAGALDPTVGGMSLAIAFVAKGSQAVIASPESLVDEQATALGVQLYAGLPGHSRFDAAEALRRAQTALWDSYPDPEQHLGRYRVWVP